MDDRWVKNQALIKTLYQDEHKTLTEVKAILERDHGFPDQPLTVYETNVRGVLRLRKRLKKTDYAIIHRFARSQGWEKYDVYLNETLIPWSKYWKEYRRSGAREQADTESGADSLPAGVAIKGRVAISRPPTKCKSPIPQHADESGEPAVDEEQALVLYSPTPPQMTELRSTDPQSLPTGTVVRALESSHSAAEASLSSVNVALQTLPWNSFRLTLFADLEPDDHAQSRPDRPATTAFPHREDLSDLLSSNNALMSDREARESLSVLTYLVSNGLKEGHAIEDDLVLLGRAIRRIPQAVVVRLFKSNSLSIQAIWDQFMRSPIPNLSRHDRSRTEVRANIALYITTTLNFNPEWRTGHEEKLLLIASSLGNRDLVSKMLRYRGRSSRSSSTGLSSIILALQAEAYDCVELQVWSCDVNDENVFLPVSVGTDGPHLQLMSHFVIFLDYAMECFRNTQGVSQRWKEYGRCQRALILAALAIFLENGADVDATYPPTLCLSFNLNKCSPYDLGQPQPSCLEVAFYCCRALYEVMKHFSRTRHCHISRIKLCKAAERGNQALADYLTGDMTRNFGIDKDFLQMVLFEVVFMRAEFVENSKGDTTGASNGIVAATLIDYGITLPLNPQITPTQMATEAFTCLLYRSRDGERLISVLSTLKHFFQLSDELCPTMLQESVDRHGTATLSALAESNDRFSSAVRKDGGFAVVMAALLGNRDAVSMLLLHGFDVNCEFRIPAAYPAISRTAVGHVLFWAPAKERPFASRLAAVRCLVDHGARIRLGQESTNCFAILRGLRYQEPQSVFDFFQFLKHYYPHEISIIPSEDWDLLLEGLSFSKPRSIPGSDESSLKTFEAILDDRPSLGSQLKLLAPVILWGGTRELIQRLIADGAKIHDFSESMQKLGVYGNSPLRAAVAVLDEELAIQLLELGAGMSRDILSVAINAKAPTREAENKKMAMIVSLIDRGADVNDSYTDGDSPLHHCARNGSIDCAALLLQRGAYPNIKSRPIGFASSTPSPKTPLDVAAEFGRLDMAHLFLMAGGLSARRGTTGYDGAIEKAKENRFNAIARLIQTHVDATLVQSRRAG